MCNNLKHNGIERYCVSVYNRNIENGGEAMESERKIFAEYHNPRYTREVDGELGNWAYTNESKNSRAKIKRYNYNADLINENGHHLAAAVHYPLVGMQSQNDPDYIEYQILLAKLAYIDGFMTDFRHLEDKAGLDQLKVLREVAGRYGFEIGVDWCDAQIFYSLRKVRPDLDTREKQIDYCKCILKYLAKNVYQDETGATICGHPVILLFGDGFSFEEYHWLKQEINVFAPKEPWYFRRAMMECAYDGKNVTYFFDERHEYFTKEHRNEIAGPFGWVPFRLRDAVNDGKPYWDVYATEEDCMAYMETLRSQATSGDYTAWISVATPGMDQRGCAAWGRAITYLERGNGELYKKFWEYNVNHREETDAVFIVSWNDFNEGHEIEPTEQNGYRELMLTMQYGAQFKGIERQVDAEELQLPIWLFQLRKKTNKLKKIGYSIADELLNEAAMLIAERNCSKARILLEQAEKLAAEQWDKTVKLAVEVPKLQLMKQSEKKNIARLAAVAADSSLEHCEVARVVDGEKLRSFWQSEPGESWLQLLWNEKHAIDTIAVFTGWLERADTPGWPMIPQKLVLEIRTSVGWKKVWGTQINDIQDLALPIGEIIDGIRISSTDAAGMVLRNIEVTERVSQTEDEIGCYEGAYFRMPEECAKRIRGNIFDGYLTFFYWDEGFGSFEVKSAGHFQTVCKITMDNTKRWKAAKVGIYPANTNWEHKMDNGADLMFCGDVTVKNARIKCNIYNKR